MVSGYWVPGGVSLVLFSTSRLIQHKAQLCSAYWIVPILLADQLTKGRLQYRYRNGQPSNQPLISSYRNPLFPNAGSERMPGLPQTVKRPFNFSPLGTRTALVKSKTLYH